VTGQLTLRDAVAGAALKEAGQDAIEQTDLVFVQRMRAAAKEISKTQGSVSSDDLRVFGCAHGIYPIHRNSYGAIFRGKGWQEIGRKKSRLPSSHAREIRIWRWQGYEAL
jgi:hypothetical protein